MGRKRRLWHSKGYYHITMRGNNRQNIFSDNIDIQEYYRILTDVYYRFTFELHAYCIMNNHVHLLLRFPEVHLGILMRNINKRYSDYYRKRHNYVGQIYQNRYFSKEIADIHRLLKVSAYIHLNPIETKIPMVKSLEKYPYSSYPAYYYNQSTPYPFVRLDMLPNLLPPKRKSTKHDYAKWCLEWKKVNKLNKKSSMHPQ